MIPFQSFNAILPFITGLQFLPLPGVEEMYPIHFETEDGFCVHMEMETGKLMERNEICMPVNPQEGYTSKM